MRFEEWVEETELVDVPKIDYDLDTRKIVNTVVKEPKKFQVRYDRLKIDDNFCTDFNHEWKVVDSHKYIIKCKNCPLNKKIMPGIEYIDAHGHVRNKETDKVVA